MLSHQYLRPSCIHPSLAGFVLRFVFSPENKNSFSEVAYNNCLYTCIRDSHFVCLNTIMTIRNQTTKSLRFFAIPTLIILLYIIQTYSQIYKMILYCYEENKLINKSVKMKGDRGVLVQKGWRNTLFQMGTYTLSFDIFQMGWFSSCQIPEVNSYRRKCGKLGGGGGSIPLYMQPCLYINGKKFASILERSRVFSFFLLQVLFNLVVLLLYLLVHDYLLHTFRIQIRLFAPFPKMKNKLQINLPDSS